MSAFRCAEKRLKIASFISFLSALPAAKTVRIFAAGGAPV